MLLAATLVCGLVVAPLLPEPFAAFGSWAPLSVLTSAPSVPAGTGPAPGGTFLTFNLAGRLQAQVNVGSGNLLVRSADLTLAGIESKVALGAAYNSLLLGSGIEVGAFGHGWRSRSGIDVQLFPASDGTVTLAAADGVVGVFSPTSTGGYSSPGVFKATLAKTSSGWNLTEHDCGCVLSFGTAGLLNQTTDRNGNVISVSYNASNKMTGITSDWGPAAIRTAQVAYGSNGFISSVTQSGTNATNRSISYGYSSAGDLTSITDPDGNVFNFGYDSSHELTSISNPTTVGGVPEQATITYDSQHRVTSLTRNDGPNGTSSTATTRLAYVSSTQTEVADPNTDQSQPVGSVPHSTYTLDAQTRVTQVTDPAGNNRSVSYTFFSDVASVTNAVGGTLTNTYGSNNGESLTKSVLPTGAAAVFAYANPATTSNPTANFQASSYTNPEGNATAYAYNGAGNVASATNALAAVASVGYNSDGTVASSTDPNNGTNSTTYSYNSDKQLVSITPPTGNSLGVRHFSYDAFGRLTTAADGAGRVTTLGYDNEDRVTSMSYSDGTTGLIFAYDGSGNLIKRTDASGITTYTYDETNRLLARANTAGGKTLNYSYDHVGNLLTLDDGRGITTYSYDSRNLLSSMTTDDRTLYTFNYDADGRRTATYFNTVAGNSTWAALSTTSYDKVGRMTRLSTALNSNPNNLVFDTSYCYSPFVAGQPCPASSASTDTGLLQYSTNNLTGTVSNDSYDKASRLIGATNVAGHNWGYSYDADGNRTSVTKDGTATQSLAYNSANQISSSGYAYDAAGNLTATPDGSTFSYNAAEQMTQATVAGTTSAYVYAGGSERELTSAGANQFVWGRNDQYGQPWLESFNTGGCCRMFVERDGAGSPLGLFSSGNGIDYFLVTDNIGSVVAVVDSSGNLAANYSYDPYGAIVNANESGLNVPNIVRYAGGALEQVTGLTKFGQRYYNSALGAFTQQDIVLGFANPGNGNLYTYAADSPINYTDPTGKFNWGLALIGVAAIVVPDAFVGLAIVFSGGTAGVFLANPVVDLTLAASNLAGLYLIYESLNS